MNKQLSQSNAPSLLQRGDDDDPGARRARDPDGPAAPAEAGTGARPLDGLRSDLTAEMLAMARHLLSGGGQIDRETLGLMRRVDQGETVPLDELCTGHANLSTLIAPATPRAVRALADGMRGGGIRVLLGPTPEVRRLAVTNIAFAVLFFGISLAPSINHETIALSIYEQSGLNLLLKLVFLLAAAGLGASFGALFDVWREISEGRYDPISESAHWMRICLGIVAGLVLAEVISADMGLRTAGTDGGAPPITEALLALVGGFSAGLLHLVVTRLVRAVENIFAPADGAARQTRRAGATAADARSGASAGVQ